jgi:hypothetical protein
LLRNFRKLEHRTGVRDAALINYLMVAKLLYLLVGHCAIGQRR